MMNAECRRRGLTIGEATHVPIMLACVAALLVPIDASMAAQADQERAAVKQGYEQLLQSHAGRYSKRGWNHYGPGYFELDHETGILTSHGGMGLFWYSVKQYGDFVLELEFKTTDVRTNSGIFLRIPDVPSSNEYIYHSFEIQIDDHGEGIHHTGAVYDAEAPSARASNAPGEWNQYKITFQGSRIEIELNGEKVVDWEAEPRGKIRDFAQRGYIGLQNHDDRGLVSFRNIFIREL